MKKLAFILLIVIVVSPCIVSAESTDCKSPNANNECLAEPGEIVIINFQGEIYHITNRFGELEVRCIAPFDDRCYTLYYHTHSVSEKTVQLNDLNQTEYSVTSDPVITTGPNGEQIYTFTTN